jgi:hypothetical protein
VARHDWIDGEAVLAEGSRGARLVETHEAAIAGYIGGQDSRQLAVGKFARHRSTLSAL